MAEQRITIKALTWHRDSSGLFDYEASNHNKSKLKLTEESLIILQQDKIISNPHSNLIPDNSIVLASLYKNNRNFMLSASISDIPKETIREKPWIVIKGIKNSEYLLSEGDVLRLGKVKFVIKEIHGYKQSEIRRSILHSKTLQNGGVGGISKVKVERALQTDLQVLESSNCCRICLLDDNDSENQLISPCCCTGTMGVVHVKCLQRWLDSKVTQNSNRNVKVYTWRSLNCELCKFKYPSKINVNHKEIDLITIEKPKTNYIILENGSEDMKSVHVINIENKREIKLGRGNDSDMRIPDISVSRNHAIIHIKNTGLYIEDLKSKFGTLIRMKKDLCLDGDSVLKIQCGRTMMKITVIKSWSLFGCFTGCSKGKDSDDENQKARDITQDSFPNNIKD
ncbi:hypothetical protein SteCoe_34644 [Stentor coeruleus]|uniref:RING-CH-type domain-containing protein n=1 Tax=Stentor coeruleus TaxID=5963 RepID=A0A1R2AU47_9CILI|nr:hypothetical protein SteCoe_34644 [Stentor coeruleus]